MKIGEVSRLTGLSIKTIRYYEDRGMLEPAARTEGGYRLYSQEEVARLRFIKRAKLLGLKLEEIKELVGQAAGCGRGEIVPHLKEVLDAKVDETEQRIAELIAFRENLLYYRTRLYDADPEDICGEEMSFCSCLEAVTREESVAGAETCGPGLEEVV